MPSDDATCHVLAELPIGELEQFLHVFATAGLAKRAEHGCLHSQVFRPLEDTGRVVVLLEWPDRSSFERFRDDPSAPPIMRQGGAQGPPTFRILSLVADLDG